MVRSISIHEFTQLARHLPYKDNSDCEGSLNFCEYIDETTGKPCNWYGIKKFQVFGSEILIASCYGGGDARAIPLLDSFIEAEVTEYLKDYDLLDGNGNVTVEFEKDEDS